MNMEKEKQVQKLARTLVRTGMARDHANALKSARSILKVPEPAEKKKDEPVDPSSLPTLEDISPARGRAGSELDRDRALKDVVEEDAGRIYSEGGIKGWLQAPKQEKSKKFI